MLEGITFANKELFWLLLINIPILAWYIYSYNKQQASLTVSSSRSFSSLPQGIRVHLRHVLVVLRMIALSAIIVALARPQSTDHWENSSTYGIDIMLAIDVSSSMLAQDFEPDRLQASKKVAADFVNSRPYDRIGLVLFSGESFTQCPLTTDHAVLLNLLKDVECGIIEDGTAIGLGFTTAISRLKDSSSSTSKIIILLTDGVNNSGDIDPLTAAEIAMAFGIRVYTIGVGSEGTAKYPVQTPFGTEYRDMEVQIDEEILDEIARMCNGQYYRAQDNESLKTIYDEIDKLEKSRIEVKQFNKKEEEFLILVIIAAIALLLEIKLKHTVFKSIP